MKFFRGSPRPAGELAFGLIIILVAFISLPYTTGPIYSVLGVAPPGWLISVLLVSGGAFLTLQGAISLADRRRNSSKD
ncbi:hypothetical protein EDF39_1111 [Frondihabitans sp. PhB161]|nr:hypothetical protein EDF37_1109 [Frondihabitans sp. PhB153]RPF08714.1 hypothetical protein EDF39_1111 [Frondihabitans sp. PhB161]